MYRFGARSPVSRNIWPVSKYKSGTYEQKNILRATFT